MIINSEKQSRGTQAPYLRKVATPPSPPTTGILTSTSIQFYEQTILRQRRLNSKSKGPLRIELKKFLRCEFMRGASKSTRYKNTVLSKIPLIPIIALKIKVWERGKKGPAVCPFIRSSLYNPENNSSPNPLTYLPVVDRAAFSETGSCRFTSSARPPRISWEMQSTLVGNVVPRDRGAGFTLKFA